MGSLTQHMKKYRLRSHRQAVAWAILTAFLCTSIQMPVFAQTDPLPFMPKPGVMVQLSPRFSPAYLKGIVIHPENALKFDFIIYRGDQPLNDAQKKEEYTKLTKYFLASLAIPDDDQWVNLSPYEKDRIIQEDFGKTEMGRDLLAQDYLLKQITASLIYPEDHLGKKFWDKVYAQAQKQYGTTNIPVNTFNKVWILPDDALIYEKGRTAYVLRNHLRVMLEEDYLSLAKHQGLKRAPKDTLHTLSSQIIRQIVLPELEREVNEGQNFAPLRQVYSGMLLATWYKRALKESFLSKIYANKAKVKGVDQDPKTNEAIFRQYLTAYKKGVFNFIKEDVDRYTHETMPRQYFSGGADSYSASRAMLHEDPIKVETAIAPDQAQAVEGEEVRDDYVAIAANVAGTNGFNGLRHFNHPAAVAAGSADRAVIAEVKFENSRADKKIFEVDQVIQAIDAIAVFFGDHKFRGVQPHSRWAGFMRARHDLRDIAIGLASEIPYSSWNFIAVPRNDPQGMMVLFTMNEIYRDTFMQWLQRQKEHYLAISNNARWFKFERDGAYWLNIAHQLPLKESDKTESLAFTYDVFMAHLNNRDFDLMQAYIYARLIPWTRRKLKELIEEARHDETGRLRDFQAELISLQQNLPPAPLLEQPIGEFFQREGIAQTDYRILEVGGYLETPLGDFIPEHTIDKGVVKDHRVLAQRLNAILGKYDFELGMTRDQLALIEHLRHAPLLDHLVRMVIKKDEVPGPVYTALKPYLDMPMIDFVTDREAEQNIRRIPGVSDFRMGVLKSKLDQMHLRLGMTEAEALAAVSSPAMTAGGQNPGQNEAMTVTSDPDVQKFLDGHPDLMPGTKLSFGYAQGYKGSNGYQRVSIVFLNYRKLLDGTIVGIVSQSQGEFPVSLIKDIKIDAAMEVDETALRGFEKYVTELKAGRVPYAFLAGNSFRDRYNSEVPPAKRISSEGFEFLYDQLTLRIMGVVDRQGPFRDKDAFGAKLFEIADGIIVEYRKKLGEPEAPQASPGSVAAINVAALIQRLRETTDESTVDAVFADSRRLPLEERLRFLAGAVQFNTIYDVFLALNNVRALLLDHSEEVKRIFKPVADRHFSSLPDQPIKRVYQHTLSMMNTDKQKFKNAVGLLRGLIFEIRDKDVFKTPILAAIGRVTTVDFNRARFDETLEGFDLPTEYADQAHALFTIFVNEISWQHNDINLGTRLAGMTSQEFFAQFSEFLDNLVPSFLSNLFPSQAMVSTFRVKPPVEIGVPITVSEYIRYILLNRRVTPLVDVITPGKTYHRVLITVGINDIKIDENNILIPRSDDLKIVIGNPAMVAIPRALKSSLEKIPAEHGRTRAAVTYILKNWGNINQYAQIRQRIGQIRGDIRPNEEAFLNTLNQLEQILFDAKIEHEIFEGSDEVAMQVIMDQTPRITVTDAVARFLAIDDGLGRAAVRKLAQAEWSKRNPPQTNTKAKIAEAEKVLNGILKQDEDRQDYEQILKLLVTDEGKENLKDAVVAQNRNLDRDAHVAPAIENVRRAKLEEYRKSFLSTLQSKYLRMPPASLREKEYYSDLLSFNTLLEIAFLEDLEIHAVILDLNIRVENIDLLELIGQYIGLLVNNRIVTLPRLADEYFGSGAKGQKHDDQIDAVGAALAAINGRFHGYLTLQHMDATAADRMEARNLTRQAAIENLTAYAALPEIHEAKDLVRHVALKAQTDEAKAELAIQASIRRAVGPEGSIQAWLHDISHHETQRTAGLITKVPLVIGHYRIHYVDDDNTREVLNDHILNTTVKPIREALERYLSASQAPTKLEYPGISEVVVPNLGFLYVRRFTDDIIIVDYTSSLNKRILSGNIAPNNFFGMEHLAEFTSERISNFYNFTHRRDLRILPVEVLSRNEAMLALTSNASILNTDMDEFGLTDSTLKALKEKGLVSLKNIFGRYPTWNDLYTRDKVKRITMDVAGDIIRMFRSYGYYFPGDPLALTYEELEAMDINVIAGRLREAWQETEEIPSSYNWNPDEIRILKRKRVITLLDWKSTMFNLGDLKLPEQFALSGKLNRFVNTYLFRPLKNDATVQAEKWRANVAGFLLRIKDQTTKTGGQVRITFYQRDLSKVEDPRESPIAGMLRYVDVPSEHVRKAYVDLAYSEASIIGADARISFKIPGPNGSTQSVTIFRNYIENIEDVKGKVPTAVLKSTSVADLLRGISEYAGQAKLLGFFGSVTLDRFVSSDYLRFSDPEAMLTKIKRRIVRALLVNYPGIVNYFRTVDPNISALYGVNASLAMVSSPEQVVDRAMNPGGIDMNAANLAMIIERDGNGVPLPLAQQDMAQIARMEGLEPEILSIQPAISTPVFNELLR